MNNNKMQSFLIIMVMVVMLVPVKLWAQEPYAVLSENNTVLTFYYDNLKEIRDGMEIAPYYDFNNRGWHANRLNITTIKFDSSFANCTSITSTANWFSGFINLTSFVGLDNLKTGNVTNMNHMFEYCSSLTSLDLSHFDTGNVTDMFGMFDNCSSLKTLDITHFDTKNVTGMGYLFNECSSLTSLDLSHFDMGNVTNTACMFRGCSSLTSITIPNSMKTIGTSAFEYCIGLTSVTIPNSVTEIGEWAFQECRSLTSVTIGNGVITIGSGAFDYCYNLTSVTIPNKVTEIGANAFSHCSGMTSVTIGYDVTIIGGQAFSGCSGLTSITIPNSVTDIGEGAFFGCSGLTSITIPNSVTSISRFTFFDCSSLTSIIIPNSVTSIGESAFDGCSSLSSIILPNSVTSIGESAFYGCSSLVSIVIPNSVTSIGYQVFLDCSSLTSVTIPNSVTSIGECAFWGCSSLSSITIPNSVTSIGAFAFSYCSSLTSVSVSNSVPSINLGVFEFCSSLVSINIPNSVTAIDHRAFSGCSSLSSITLPNSVANIGGAIFMDCSNLTSVTCMATEVPVTNNEAFSYVNLNNTTLYVSKGCVEKYAAAEPWNIFGKIVEIGAQPTDMTMEEAAKYLQKKGVIDSGDPEVDKDALRSHLAKIAFRGLYLLNGRQVPEEIVSDGFPTVYEDIAIKTPSNEYYYQPAKALLYLEYGDGVTPFDRNRLKFEPEKTILRVNVLKALMETFNIKPDLEKTNNPFPDDEDVVKLASKNPRLMGYVREAERLGIITKGRPYDNCLRGEAFLMLARIMQKIEAGEIEEPDPQDKDYFQPLNTTLATVGLGAGLQMGNFQHYTKTSFAMSGVVPLSFSHTYNSYNTTLPNVFFGAKVVNNIEETYQPLGDGWSHNYHSFITLVAEPTEEGTEKVMKLIVHWGGGQIDVYKAEDGKFVPESMGIYDDLSQDGNEVVIKSKSQMEYRFSKQGSTGANVLYLYSVTDRNGNELTINYQNGQNGSKRISSVSDGQRSLVFGYLDGTDLLEEVKDPLNRSIKFTYFDNKQTGKKQLKTFTDAEDNTTVYEYADETNAGASKLLSRIQLPKGNYTENEYDANRRLSTTVSGINGVPTSKTSVSVNTDYTDSKAFTQSTVTVERATQSSTYHYAYNENNVMTGMTGAEDLFMNRSYDNDMHPELPTAIESNRTYISDISYDPKGNVTSITVSGDDGTLTTSMTYDEMNNLISMTDPNENKTAFTYDSKGNLTDISAPEGVTSNIVVNTQGLPTTVTNAMGVKTKLEYNKYGNLTKTTLLALSLSSEASYDDASRLTSVTDALGRTSSFGYNNNDYLTSETDAMSHTTQYGYDENDNLTSITNAKGGVTTLTYDNATDWLTSVEFAGAKKQYDYNNDGTLNTFTKPDGTILSYSYDDLGRVTSDGINSYSYDSKLRLSEVSDGDKTVSLKYDGFNRIIGTTYNGHSNNYSYDNNGNCTKVNGVEYGYDGLNRLTSVTFGEKTITYSYRKDSQLSKVSYPNGMTTEFGYDAVGRLTSKQTKLNNGTVVAGYTFELDKVGNITSQTTKEPYGDMVLVNEDVDYTYNDANRITQAGGIDFEFDKNGNTTKRGSESYTWDKKDRLTGAGSTEITYDPLGLIASYDDITFTTDPLGMGNVLSDSRSGAEYIYGNGLEARIKDGKTSYYVTDVRGSVVAIVDERGNVTHKYQYDEFGKVTQKQEADYNPFQYVGKYGVMYLTDHQYYMRARHYDPSIGRFLSEDPIWSANLYPYADNNPVMGIDPRGLETTDDVDAWYQREHWKNVDLYNSGKFNSRDEYIATQNKLDADYINRYKKAKQHDEEIQEEPSEIFYVGSPSQKSYKINPNDYISVLNYNNPLRNSNDGTTFNYVNLGVECKNNTDPNCQFKRGLKFIEDSLIYDAVLPLIPKKLRP